MKRFLLSVVLFTLILSINAPKANAQIWEPEGINMPGDWNGWTNPPTNNLALASYTQVAGGLVTKISNGTNARWTTTIHVAAAGGDVVGGNYGFLITSGSGNPWANKWTDVNVVSNTIQNYTWHNDGGGANNNVTLINDKWYTINWEDVGYGDTKAIFMELSAAPVAILTVSEPANVLPNTPVTVDVTLSAAASVEELFYLRYTTDNWLTSIVEPLVIIGTNGSASIPGQAVNTLVKYYAFSSVTAGLVADFDLQTLMLNNNAGTNYTYTIGAPPPPPIDWANLQWPPTGTIGAGDSYVVYGQIYVNGVTDPAGQGVDIQAWVGYNDMDTDPATWTNWVPATYLGDVSNNDEYSLDLGAVLPNPGTVYYATRFQYLTGDFVYGGFNGGFWDGTNNVNGTVTMAPPVPLSNWAIGLFGIFFLTFVFIKIRK